MNLNEIKADVTIDVSGLMCPMPGLKTIKVIRSLNTGQILEVKSSHPIFKMFGPTITRKFGGDILGITDEVDGFSRLYVKKS